MTNSLYEQLVNKVRKKSWMLLFTIFLTELTVQETNHDCQGNCFLYFQVGLNTCLPWNRLSIHCTQSNCQVWICGKFMYDFILKRVGKGLFLVRILRCGSMVLAYFQKKKKDQCCLVDHTGRTEYRLFLNPNMWPRNTSLHCLAEYRSTSSSAKANIWHWQHSR